MKGKSDFFFLSFDKKKILGNHCCFFQIVQFGMNQAVGPVSFDLPQQGNALCERPFGESAAQLIDLEVRSLIDAAFHRTYQLLVDKREMVEKV